MKKNLLVISIITLLFSQNCLAFDVSDHQPVFSTKPVHKEHNSWFIEKTNPGNQLKESLLIKNLSNQSITLDLKFREMKGTPETAEIIESDNFQNIGKWITFDQEQITLAPHESKTTNFKINVPENISPTMYQGTILVSYHDKTQNSLNLITRLGNRVYLEVTNNKIVQADSFNLDISGLQIGIISLSVLGLLYGFKKNKNENENS